MGYTCPKCNRSGGFKETHIKSVFNCSKCGHTAYYGPKRCGCLPVNYPGKIKLRKRSFEDYLKRYRKNLVSYTSGYSDLMEGQIIAIDNIRLFLRGE